MARRSKKAIMRRLEVSRATIVASRAISASFLIYRRPVPAADVEQDLFQIVACLIAVISLRDLQVEWR